uniref:DDE Tnp4 domain-containing protein n=1 Tax=Tetranychus urticae TaxID=32264 RepID=T1L5D7_TETUR
MVVYCHICGKRLVAGNKKSFTREVLSAYMTAKHRVAIAEESTHSCRSCAVDIEVWRRVTEPEQYRESEDTVSEASSSSSSVSQASSYASMSTVFSDASTESSRRKRRRSDLLIGQTLPTMFEEEDEEDAEPEQPSFASERFSHLIKRRRCLYGCEWTRAADLRILKTDERFALLQDQKIYAATDTYICKSHENSEFDDERVLSADFLTRRFTVKEFEDALSLSLSASVARPFRDGVPVPDERCKRWTGLTYGAFSSLCSDVTLRRSRKKMLPIAVYLAKLRTGDSLERIADTFCISLSSAKNHDKLAREALLEHFVPRNLGFQHLDRETALSHVTTVSKALFNVEDDDADKMICIADGTYIYHQKSFHNSHQRESYSPHKYRHLFKPMMIVAPDGYILEYQPSAIHIILSASSSSTLKRALDTVVTCDRALNFSGKPSPLPTLIAYYICRSAAVINLNMCIERISLEAIKPMKRIQFVFLTDFFGSHLAKILYGDEPWIQCGGRTHPVGYDVAWATGQASTAWPVAMLGSYFG